MPPSCRCCACTIGLTLHLIASCNHRGSPAEAWTYRSSSTRKAIRVMGSIWPMNDEDARHIKLCFDPSTPWRRRGLAAEQAWNFQVLKAHFGSNRRKYGADKGLISQETRGYWMPARYQHAGSDLIASPLCSCEEGRTEGLLVRSAGRASSIDERLHSFRPHFPGKRPSSLF